MRDVDGVFAPPNPLRGEVHDGAGRDLDLRREQVITAAQPARTEDAPWRKGAPLPPHDQAEQHQQDDAND